MALGQVYPELYEQQLAEKAAQTTALLSGYALPAIELFRSEPSHYRQRAEFRIWHEGDDLFHIMFDPETKQKQRIDYFPVASKRIADFMPVLLEKLKQKPELRHKLYQVDYLSTFSGELLVSLIYKKPLADNWAEQAAALKQELADFAPLDFIGRARKQKVLVDRDYVMEQLTVQGRKLSYQQVENSFTQPNAGVNQQMLGWACDIAKQLDGDLLELYCGNGNFSLALAPYFRQVVATEISRSSIKSAQLNIELNKVANLQVLQMSAEDVSTAMTQGKALKQLDLSHLQLDTILVDPPRAGLDAATEQFVSQFQDILYISCNPETLAHNLKTLSQTHHIQAFALFDQFPYSHHIESGVWLRKINP
ncbi:tRNA (uridine(54)-C5)-methyltransferase TrmA [Rheinheimera sp.]|uniref:tRNA (uridine(54)-C5)-methyltransferase TrmA n=1 Tax=Rheinheimera sp. TaxID=1869214 RepID=UPI00307D8D71